VTAARGAVNATADAAAARETGNAPRLEGAALYRTLWRWHFYAGLWCIPFVILLACTGSLYLFKPQFEAWQDRAFESVAFAGPRIGAEAEVAKALLVVPGAKFAEYELPHAPQAAGRVWLRSKDGEKVRVVVQPVTGEVLDVVEEKARLMHVIHDLHGELLLGDGGSLFVELAACWAIVMVLSGLYLWWPRSARGMAGVLYLRVGQGQRIFWRDLHAVTGVWISLLALFLLFSGLPWTGVWGKAFKEVRQLTSTAVVKQDWAQSRSGERSEALATAPMGESADAEHAEHAEHAGHAEGATATAGKSMTTAGMTAPTVAAAAPEAIAVTLDEVVATVAPLGWAAPVLVSPPGAKAPPWARKSAVSAAGWNVRSDAQNRPLRQSLVVDALTGEMQRHETFADKPVIDRVVSVGVAAHEGQLFGAWNQVLGVLTAAGLVLLSVSGVVMWWRRRPDGVLGAPLPPLEAAQYGKGLLAIIVILGVFLPVLGAALLLVGFIEWALLRRVAALRDWFGLANHAANP
jgi:uncharacterized iron-regulated membrane protein